MKLHHHSLSGHAHRVRLFLSLLSIPHELVAVAGAAHRNVRAWLGRIEAQPGFVAFQASPVGLAA